MSQQGKISVYNHADLKNTSDDAIPNYLNSLKFKQTHFLSDVRLGLGYGAFLLAAACFGWDYLLGFDATKTYTMAAVGCYMVLSYAMTRWQKDIERGQIYVGSSPDGKKEISIATKSKKYTTDYDLEIAITDITDGQGKAPEPEIIKVTRPFTEWFDETGLFVAQPFQEVLATAIPLVGKYDPKRVKNSSQELLDNPELLDAVMGAEATGADAELKKGGKKRRS